MRDFEAKKVIGGASRVVSVRGLVLIVALVALAWLMMRTIQLSPEPMSRPEAAESIQRLLAAARGYEQLYGRSPFSHTDRNDDAGASWRLLIFRDVLGPEAETIIQSDWRQLEFQLSGHPVVSHRFFSLTKPSTAIQRIFGDESPNTKVMAVVGPDTAYNHIEAGGRITDLPSDVILFVEVSETGCHWLQPGDVNIGSVAEIWNNDHGMRIGGNYECGFFVGFADGEVWFIDSSVPLERLIKFFTVQGARTADRDEMLSNFVIERFAALPEWTIKGVIR